MCIRDSLIGWLIGAPVGFRIKLKRKQTGQSDPECNLILVYFRTVDKLEPDPTMYL